LRSEDGVHGTIAAALMGDPNASIPTPQPVHYRPMFGACGRDLRVWSNWLSAHRSGSSARWSRSKARATLLPMAQRYFSVEA
jgi:hypothetical protein